jgi:ribosomal subunit interface protein
MDSPLEITWHNTQSSEALEQLIRDRGDRMHRYFDHINSAHVIVNVPHRSQQGKLGYHVTIEVGVPGRTLAVSHDPVRSDTFDPYIAVRRAFDAMDRQLEQFSQKVRGDVKSLDGPPQGRVVRLFPEYGFVEMLDGQEIWFGPNALVAGRFEDLEVGDSVELTVAEGEGAMGPQASMVRPITEMQLDGDIPSRS